MVAFGSRFALLATFCAVATVSYTPLTASAAAVEARHSDKSGTPERDRHSSKQPVIPLPHKLSKASIDGSGRNPAVEHGRLHKGKGKERESGVEQSPAYQLIRIVQFPVKYKRHHDDDCPRKVVVNGDRNHLHLACHDHDHHDHHDDDHDHDREEVIVNGDRDHVRTRRGELRLRSPKHSRPLLQRRNDTTGHGFGSDGVLGTVTVVGTDESGQDKAYGEFWAEDGSDGYDVGVSHTNHTMFYLVGTNTTSPINGSQVPVTLQTMLPNRYEMSCCSYDRNPVGPRPMAIETCREAGVSDGGLSQLFLFEPGTGNIQPMWGQSNGNSTIAAPPSNQTSANPPQPSGGKAQGNGSGDQNVRMVWKPYVPSDGSRMSPASTGVETQTVTVTVTAGSSSPDASPDVLREASSALIDATPGPTSSAMESPLLTQASASPAPSTSALAPTSTAQDTSSIGLKVEVAPNQPTPSDSITPSSSVMVGSSSAIAGGAGATATDSVAASSIPAREGGVETTLSERYVVQSGLDGGRSG